MEHQTLILHIRCTDLPSASFAPGGKLRIGIQRKSEVVDDVPSAGDEVVFRTSVVLKRDIATGRRRFSGDCVHGAGDERFIYLCWGERDGREWRPLRRAKLQLGGMPEEVAHRAVASDTPVVASVRCTNHKGEPVAATLRPDAVRWEV